jgi:hypothetical protein
MPLKTGEFYSTQDCRKTLAEMVASLLREWNMRKRVYPKWVEGGRMTAEKAQHEIDCMEAAHQVLTRVLAAHQVLTRVLELQETSQEMIAEEKKRQQRNEQTKLEL